MQLTGDRARLSVRGGLYKKCEQKTENKSVLKDYFYVSHTTVCQYSLTANRDTSNFDATAEIRPFLLCNQMTRYLQD